jgi:CDP-diacylglycerol pyrophosphatase
VLAAIFCAGVTAPAAGANRDALRQIVQEQCSVHWLAQHDPTPCDRVVLPDADDVSRGYAVLADRKGGAHFLLIPTRTIAGLESPAILDAAMPNYFAAAWDARDRLEAAASRRIPRDAVGLALNPQRARSQDQLHIHIECLGPQAYHALTEAGPRITDVWSAVYVDGFKYHALRIRGETLNEANPITMVARHVPDAGRPIGEYTLLLAGFTFKDGPGFILLAGTGPAAELLLDSTCAVVRP